METGAVLTATEVEGVASPADWSLWVRRGRAPKPELKTPFADSWTEDIEQLASLGISALQITLEWAALEPRPGEHDEIAIEFRRQLIQEAKANGLQVWACLVDGTLPGWFADDAGGFIDDQARSLIWPRHIDWIGEHYGDLVDGWVPQREPITWALRRYLLATAPPGRSDPVVAAKAVQAAVLADGEAWRLLKGTAPVAMYQTGRTIRPRNDDIKAKPRAADLERLLWHPWMRALGQGQLLVGDLPPRTVDHLRGAFDRLIVELRPAIEVDGTGHWHPYPADRAQGPTGWVAWPESMAENLRRVADELEREIVAAGNLADVNDDGRARPDHLQATLDLTAEATADTTVIGWWQSSPIDGYHWERGSSINPGIIRQDRTEADAAKTLRAFNPRASDQKP
ncbi:MAG: family 1 glycosylhydrolase [Actinomycetia bacterium]|nr:family 1 glycosylhydrolase [Actinomycetes bacterium]